MLVWYEDEYPSISYISMISLWLYLIKNHIIDYNEFKNKCLLYINNNIDKQWLNIINNKDIQNQINDLIKSNEDNKQWIEILNNRLSLQKWSSTSQLINNTYDELFNKISSLQKQNDILSAQNKDLINKYNDLYIDHENIKSDLSNVIDKIKNIELLLTPKEEWPKKSGLMWPKKTLYSVKK